MQIGEEVMRHVMHQAAVRSRLAPALLDIEKHLAIAEAAVCTKPRDDRLRSDAVGREELGGEPQGMIAAIGERVIQVIEQGPERFLGEGKGCLVRCALLGLLRPAERFATLSVGVLCHCRCRWKKTMVRRKESGSTTRAG